MSEQVLTHEQALAFVQFVFEDDMVLRHIAIRGKGYNVWVLKRTGKRIISEKRLASLSVAQFAEYLNARVNASSPWGYRRKFPDPNVYR